MTDVRRQLAMRDQAADHRAAKMLNKKIHKIQVPLPNGGTGVLVLHEPTRFDPHWKRLSDNGTWDQLDRRLDRQLQELVAWHGRQPKQDFGFGVEDAHAAIGHAALDAR